MVLHISGKDQKSSDKFPKSMRDRHRWQLNWFTERIVHGISNFRQREKPEEKIERDRAQRCRGAWHL